MTEPTPPATPAWCIISVYRPHLLDDAKKRFAGYDVEVIMDRRVGERRQPERAQSKESRARDRRTYHIDELLRTQGFAIVPRQG